MIKESKQNILVIGSIGHKRATKCIQWGELVYVGDYDALIVNTTTLTKDKLQEIIQRDSNYFDKLRKDIADVQQNKGILITCIMSPYIFSRDSKSLDEGNIDDLLRNSVNNYSWSPIIPILEPIPPAEKLQKEKSTIPKEYLDKIKHYTLLYNGSVNNTGYVDKSRDGRIYTKCHKYSLLKNSVGRDVAFAITWKLHQYSDYTVLIDSHLPIEFLPPIENVAEGIDIIINEICRIHDEKAPEWITEIVLPGEKQIQKKIDDKLREIDSLNKEIEELEKELENFMVYKKLLYSRGIDLEETVELSLSLLGIDLKKPTPSNVEDRFFETPDNQKIYFEIRGTNRLMNENDLAQLIKRVAEKPKSSYYKTRGVFIFNHQNKIAPKEREVAFHHNIEQQAKSFNLCLLDTNTLFKLVVKKLKGEKLEDFVQQLFNTVGVFKIKDGD